MSEVFQAVRSIEWDAGHRVPNHISKCRNVHGHRYKLEVTVEGPLVLSDGASDEGMVMDFSEIKKHMEYVASLFDHRFIMSRYDPLKQRLMNGLCFTSNLYSGPDQVIIYGNELGVNYLVPEFGWVQEIDSIPTAECLAYICYKLLSGKVDQYLSGIRVAMVRLWETPNCVAVYTPPEFIRVEQENGAVVYTDGKPLVED